MKYQHIFCLLQNYFAIVLNWFNSKQKVQHQYPVITLSFTGFCFNMQHFFSETLLNEQKQLTDKAGVGLSKITFGFFAGSLQG